MDKKYYKQNVRITRGKSPIERRSIGQSRKRLNYNVETEYEATLKKNRQYAYLKEKEENCMKIFHTKQFSRK